MIPNKVDLYPYILKNSIVINNVSDQLIIASVFTKKEN